MRAQARCHTRLADPRLRVHHCVWTRRAARTVCHNDRGSKPWQSLQIVFQLWVKENPFNFERLQDLLTGLVMKNSHVFGMFRSPVIAPSNLPSEYILSALKPFKTDQRSSPRCGSPMSRSAAANA